MPYVFHASVATLSVEHFSSQNYQFLPLSVPRNSQLLSVRLLTWESLQFLFLCPESDVLDWQREPDCGQRLLFLAANTAARLPMEEAYRLVQCLTGESLAAKSELLIFCVE